MKLCIKKTEYPNERFVRDSVYFFNVILRFLAYRSSSKVHRATVQTRRLR